MAKDKKPTKKEQELQQQNEELQTDLQRLRADFENFRKRTEQDVERARETGESSATLKLLPVIDNIERAISHMPQKAQQAASSKQQALANWEKWGDGVANLVKQLEKSLDSLGVKRIDATPGTPFDPELHEAVMSEEGDGEEPVITEEMQAGYRANGTVIRHSMVKVSS